MAFRLDTEDELEIVRKQALEGGAVAAVVSNHWAEGGAGARALAEAVVEACEGPSQFKFLYDLDLPIEEKISIIAKEIYGADGIQLSELARNQIDTYTSQGYGNLPSMFASLLVARHKTDSIALVCMAKTQYSFSHDANLKNVPTGALSIPYLTTHLPSTFLTIRTPGFTVPIRAVRLSAGAGFLYPLLGDMQTMPGLPTRPGEFTDSPG